MRRCSSVVAFVDIVVDSLGETSRCIFGRVFFVDFESLLECVGHIVRLVELGALDLSRLGVIVSTQYSVGAVRREGWEGREGRERGEVLFRTPSLLPA